MMNAVVFFMLFLTVTVGVAALASINAVLSVIARPIIVILSTAATTILFLVNSAVVHPIVSIISLTLLVISLTRRKQLAREAAALKAVQKKEAIARGEELLRGMRECIEHQERMRREAEERARAKEQAERDEQARLARRRAAQLERARIARQLAAERDADRLRHQRLVADLDSGLERCRQLEKAAEERRQRAEEAAAALVAAEAAPVVESVPNPASATANTSVPAAAADDFDGIADGVPIPAPFNISALYPAMGLGPIRPIVFTSAPPVPTPTIPTAPIPLELANGLASFAVIQPRALFTIDYEDAPYVVDRDEDCEDEDKQGEWVPKSAVFGDVVDDLAVLLGAVSLESEFKLERMDDMDLDNSEAEVQAQADLAAADALLGLSGFGSGPRGVIGASVGVGGADVMEVDGELEVEEQDGQAFAPPLAADIYIPGPLDGEQHKRDDDAGQVEGMVLDDDHLPAARRLTDCESAFAVHQEQQGQGAFWSISTVPVASMQTSTSAASLGPSPFAKSAINVPPAQVPAFGSIPSASAAISAVNVTPSQVSAFAPATATPPTPTPVSSTGTRADPSARSQSRIQARHGHAGAGKESLVSGSSTIARPSVQKATRLKKAAASHARNDRQPGLAHGSLPGASAASIATTAPAPTSFGSAVRSAPAPAHTAVSYAAQSSVLASRTAPTPGIAPQRVTSAASISAIASVHQPQASALAPIQPAAPAPISQAAVRPARNPTVARTNEPASASTSAPAARASVPLRPQHRVEARHRHFGKAKAGLSVGSSLIPSKPSKQTEARLRKMAEQQQQRLAKQKADREFFANLKECGLELTEEEEALASAAAGGDGDSGSGQGAALNMGQVDAHEDDDADERDKDRTLAAPQAYGRRAPLPMQEDIAPFCPDAAPVESVEPESAEPVAGPSGWPSFPEAGPSGTQGQSSVQAAPVAARVPDNKVDSELAALLEVTSSPEVLKLERERTAAKQKQEEEALNASAAAAEQQRREAAQRAEEAKAQAQKDIARIMGQQRRR